MDIRCRADRLRGCGSESQGESAHRGGGTEPDPRLSRRVPSEHETFLFAWQLTCGSSESAVSPYKDYAKLTGPPDPLQSRPAIGGGAGEDDASGLPGATRTGTAIESGGRRALGAPVFAARPTTQETEHCD
ncbi:hypothetical protein GCM10010440_59870 [Kitasatospora cinereorecta]